MTSVPLDVILAQVEDAIIRQCLRESPSLTAAAKRLGLSRAALCARMARLGMPVPLSREPP